MGWEGNQYRGKKMDTSVAEHHTAVHLNPSCLSSPLTLRYLACMDHTVAVALLDVRRIELGQQVPRLAAPKPTEERKKKRKRKSVCDAHTSSSSSTAEDPKSKDRRVVSFHKKIHPERKGIRNTGKGYNGSEIQFEPDAPSDDCTVFCMSSPDHKKFIKKPESYQCDWLTDDSPIANKNESY
jgi:hypothetical protein